LTLIPWTPTTCREVNLNENGQEIHYMTRPTGITTDLEFERWTETFRDKRSESEEFSGINGIHLDYLPQLNGLWYWASRLVFLPL